ncbi:MAG: cysteine peptidase family C39 domain-containing protein, partial [Bacteroidales bacterium]
MNIHNKKILVRQHDMSDCGAACLSSVLAYYGSAKPISRIRLEAGTNKNGTSLLGLVEVARKENLIAKPVKINNNKIDQSDLPAIAHVKIKNCWFHYVVIYKKTEEGFLIMDPAYGKLINVGLKEFLAEWTGVLLILSPGKKFLKKNEIQTSRQRIINLLKDHKNELTKSVAGAIIYSILGLATAKYVETLSDKIIPGNELKSLHIISLALLVIVILRVLVGYLKNILIIRTGKKIDIELINNYNSHIISLPIS